MHGFDPKEAAVRRRDFIKVAALAGMAPAWPGTALAADGSEGLLKPQPGGAKKRLLFASDSPASFEKFLESVRALRAGGLTVDTVAVNYQKAEETVAALRGREADAVLMCLPRSIFSYGDLSERLGTVGAPVVFLAQNPDLILIDVNFAAAVRIHNPGVLFAVSQAQALDMLKTVTAPRVLEGKRALLFGRPFDSTSSPMPNLDAETVYRRTGVRLEYRPMEDLKRRFDATDGAGAAREAERWKKEAVRVMEPSDKTILDACRLYVALRSMIDKEGWSAVGIDCLGLVFGPKLALPYPCLAFSRLRDEGITAACESDVCGTLTSMLLAEVCRRPAFFSNVLSVDPARSGTALSHCVSPLKMLGDGAAPLPYRLRDYHGMGQGVVPEVEFPAGMEVMACTFTKDLRNFFMWPGRVRVGTKTDDPSAKPASPGGFTRMTCSNYMELKIPDAGGFLQNIAGIHQIVIAGNHAEAIRDALLAMNTGVIGPSDFSTPK